MVRIFIAIQRVVPRLVRGIQRGLSGSRGQAAVRRRRTGLCLITFIRIYRYAFSALFGQRCRFHPTCSAYAIEAINIHGCLKGCYYALRRLLRCHPWHSGGVDPVP